MITNDILYVGTDDRDIDLFEGQFVVPKGVAYNSYVILDDKIAVMDTVDKRREKEFLANLEKALDGRSPDYLVISHVEPDHASSVGAFLDRYPDARLVGNAKTFQILSQYFDLDYDSALTIGEGDVLSLGRHELQFILAPMVHWPEVMFTYDSYAKTLFSADAFGKFGALDAQDEWAPEARRYYFNIVGKFGAPAQAILKKASSLDIRIICPLHGPVLSENLDYYLDKYNLWTNYEPELEGIFIAYASLHGNTAEAAKKLSEILQKKGAAVTVCDLARDDAAEALSNAFCYGKIVLAASSYNGGVAPGMEDFLHHLKGKNYQKRTVALIENGSWAPSAGRTMKELLSQMRDISILDTSVTIRGTMKEENIKELETLADELLK